MMVKTQEVAPFAISLAFLGRFEHDVVLLILIFVACQFVQGLSVGTKDSDLSLASLVFPNNFEQVFTR